MIEKVADRTYHAVSKRNVGVFRILACNEGGYTVILALFVVAMLLANGIAIFTMFVQANRHSETVLVDEQMANLNSQIDSMVNGELSCRTAFGGPTTDCYSGANPYTCPASVDTANAPVLISGGCPGGAACPEVRVRLYQRDGTTVLFADSVTDATASAFGRLTISKLALQVESLIGGDVYRARLTLEVDKPAAAGLLGNSKYVRNTHLISVKARAGTGKLYSCNGVSFSPVGLGSTSLPLPVCNPGQGIISTGTSVGCVNMVCPTGFTSSGTYDASGNIICI